LEEGKSYVDAFIGAPAQTAMMEITQKIMQDAENGTDTLTDTETTKNL
jgi:hypothetical protein